MKVFTQTSRCPNQVLFAFDEVVDSHVDGVRWATAYSTLGGCKRLVDRVERLIGRERWREIGKQFITSLDFGLTEPAALEYLAELPMSSVFVANPQVVEHPGFRPAKAYHPKVYLFDSAAYSGFVVGSANLTNSALITNTEVVIAGREQPQEGSWEDVWIELHHNTFQLTENLLVTYRDNWVRPPTHLVEPEHLSPPPTLNAGESHTLWEAITSDSFIPQSHNHLWVMAGSMSSGGSHNQLELPRGANQFFGFNHSNYRDSHINIGRPTLTLRNLRWEDRPLTWHGNNRMERLNLPTLAHGGFNYRNTAIMFRRHRTGFELEVLPWKDPAAVAWREASRSLGYIFRVGGGNSNRICGFY